MNYFYQAFGLNISSEFEIPLLTAGGDGSDLVIQLGQVSKCAGEILFENEEYQIGLQEFLLRVPGIGSFLVVSGNRIIVNPESTDRLNDIYIYILGTCLGALLYQRGDICLHGSLVKVGAKAVLLTGESGTGKSTISSVLCSKGYPFLTDDIALVRNIAGRVLVYPSYPQKKLWNDAIQHLGLLADGKKRYKILETEEKYSICYLEYFWNQPLELAHIYNFIIADTDTVQISDVSGIRKMNVLTENTYRSFLIKYFGLMNKYFDLCSLIIDKVKMHDIQRPLGLMTQHEIADLIIENSYK